jgi:demethylmenaquinone methyltransferase / 2-methoxy-6-polyprenyl-1,4-benzoquinol methylase
MFSLVAERYDLANSVLSLGIHHLWRKELVRWSGAIAGMRVLDCATGTGDLAIVFKKAVGNSGAVLGTDFCSEMLESAPKKSAARGLQIEFAVADVMSLPYADNSFDISSISFGIRNVSDPLLGLSELARVTKPGGVVMVLEFGQMQWPVISSAYNFYPKRILPFLGGMVTGQKQAYDYLQTSSANFPCRQEFASLMKSTGQFSEVEFKSLSGGIAYLYKAQKSHAQI